jgi:predicted MFS family arabinose efflux permease
MAPRWVKRSADGLSSEVPAARAWSAVLALVPTAMALALVWPVGQAQWVVIGGLVVFGFAFAVNSSVHSYLILVYAGSEKAAEDVGFYYAANALGRFVGTLLSGLLYQWGGLLYALVGSALMLVACAVLTWFLPAQLAPEGPAVHE